MVFILSFLLLPLLAAAQRLSCYYPDGSLAVNDTPCRSNANSVCCGDGFACLENGVCQVTTRARQIQPNLAKNIDYFRGSCTDQTWASSDCPQFCIGTQYAMDGGNSMQFCSSDEFCCFGGTCDCSTHFNTTEFTAGAEAFTTIGVDQASSTTSSTTTRSLEVTTSSLPTTATSISVTSTSPKPSNTSTVATPESTSNSGSLSTGAKAGIGVGVPLGVLALAAIGFLVYRMMHQDHEISELRTRLARDLAANANKNNYEIGELSGRSAIKYSSVPPYSDIGAQNDTSHSRRSVSPAVELGG